MKFLVYLLMWLLLEPILQVGGVTVAGLFLVGLVVLGVYLLVRRKDRPVRGPQDHYVDGLQETPQVVYVVSPTQCPLHDEASNGALHPARRPQRNQSGALRWGPNR